jgi:hypothetical protein
VCFVVLPKKVVICQCCWLSWQMLRRKCCGLTMVDTVLKDGPQKSVLKVLRMEKIWKNKASVMLTCWLVWSGVFVGSGLDVVIG